MLTIACLVAGLAAVSWWVWRNAPRETLIPVRARRSARKAPGRKG